MVVVPDGLAVRQQSRSSGSEFGGYGALDQAGIPHDGTTKRLEGDGVDPFAGSNTTGMVAEDLDRGWISADRDTEYVRSSALRFGIDPREVLA